MHAYFGFDGHLPMTLEAIGDAMGLTRARVRQLRNKALAKVRKHYGTYLKDFALN